MKNYFKIPYSDKSDGVFIFSEDDQDGIEKILNFIKTANPYDRPIPVWTYFKGLEKLGGKFMIINPSINFNTNEFNESLLLPF